MSKKSDLFALPTGPAELCFDKNEFMKKTFSVDDFLHEHRNAASLETMRDDLGIYLKVLRSAMIELINEDYADFVNLSSNLIGLDQSIATIQKPLDELQAEVANVMQILTDNMDEINECLNLKKQLRNYKKNLQSLGKARSSIAKLEDLLENQLNSNEIRPVVLERAALELIQLKCHTKFCSEYLTSEQTEKAVVLHDQLLAKIRTYLLSSLSSNNPDSIERCLRIYTTLDECRAAEKVFKDDVVATYMDEKVNENTLQNSQHGLAGIYNQILDFVPLHMKELLLLTHHTDKVKGFRFLINSYWTDVETRLETNMASIFAPGNPDAFFVKYKCTQDFLARIETILGNEQAIGDFRDHERTKSFFARWNLPVYFQIRFQEIAGALELACALPLNENIVSKANELKVVPFNTAVTNISRCWSNGVYIENLFHKFWKLNIQLLARLAMWLSTTVVSVTDAKSEFKMNKISFFVTIYADVVRLIGKFPNILTIAKEKAPPEVGPHTELLDRCVKESERVLHAQLENIENAFVKEISTKSSGNIRQVSDIPRLFRKTNRDVPSKQCAYVEAMVEPVKSFRSQYQSDIGAEKINSIVLRCLSAVTVQYFGAVKDVLTSVQKTEESLRRLKNLREKNPASQTSSDRQVMSDDHKIRLQLQVDVIFWTKETEKMNISCAQVDKLVDLVNLIEEATKVRIGDK